MDDLDSYLLAIPIAAGITISLVAVCIVVVLLVALIITTVLRALNPSHPISPFEEID